MTTLGYTFRRLPTEPVIAAQAQAQITTPHLAMVGQPIRMPVARRFDRISLFGAIFGLTILMVGCQPVKSNQEIAATQESNTLQQDISASASSLTTTTAKIKSDNQNIVATATTDGPKLMPFTTDISVQTGTQEQIAVDLKSKDAQISNLTHQIASLDKSDTADKATIAKLSGDNAKLENKVGLDFEIFGGIGLAAGIALCIVGGAYLGVIAKYAGMALGIAGGVAVCLGLFINSVQPLIPWITLAVVIIALGFGIYYVIAHRNAITQVVATTQAAKQLMSPAARVAIFGNGAIGGDATVKQSTTTEAIVANALASAPVVASLPVALPATGAA